MSSGNENVPLEDPHQVDEAIRTNCRVIYVKPRSHRVHIHGQLRKGGYFEDPDFIPPGQTTSASYEGEAKDRPDLVEMWVHKTFKGKPVK